MYQKLKFNKRHRECSKIHVKNSANKETNRRTLLYTGLALYNDLNIGQKLMHPKKLKYAMKKNKNKM